MEHLKVLVRPLVRTEFRRFAVIGTGMEVVGYGLILVLTELYNLDYQWAAGILFIPTIIVMFLVQRTWVFNSQEVDYRKQMKWFVVKSVAFYVLGAVAIYGLSAWFNEWYFPLQVSYTTAMSVGNFYVTRLILRV